MEKSEKLLIDECIIKNNYAIEKGGALHLLNVK